MGLVADLNNKMIEWESNVFKTTPTVPDIKRAWADKQYAMCVYLVGLKKGMDAAYKSVRKVWDFHLQLGWDVGQNKEEGIAFFNAIQEGSWLKDKNLIPKHTRVASEFWNQGKILEGLYLAGIRRGWIQSREIFWTPWVGLKWIQDKGFPP